MRFVKQIDDLLARIEAGFITLILSVMILLSFSQVILRNFFHDSILWGDIFLRQMVLWVAFLGASLAARERQHIAIDFLPNVLPPLWKKPIRIFTSLCAAGISIFLARAAWTFVAFEREAESVLFLNLPVWIFQTVLPYSFFLLTIRFLLNAVEDLLASGSDSP
ncbi:MAG: TRAP transporter small permease [Nitrospinae bacterium]|nr:TRAP transporter small permease [Nitrospinota bacterium]